MFSGQYIWVSLSLLTIAGGNWVYDWPYGSNGECRCKKIDIQTGYTDEASCLEAFAGEPYEYCFAEAQGKRIGGITESDCANYAVSTSATQSNMDCEVDCVKVVVGAMTQAEFFAQCKLETVAEFGSSVSPAPSSCFVNFVLGHADFDPAMATDASMQPLKSFEEVESAAKCQSLCQQLDDCAWFQWRAKADDVCNTPNGNVNGYQSAPFTCELYNYKFVEAVMSLDVKDIDGQDKTHYIGGVCDVQEFEDQGCSDFLKTSSWSPFAPVKCLSCECDPRCAFKSFSHISGPAYCGKDIVTDVCSIIPPFPHTTPVPTTQECTTRECITRECTTPECTTPHASLDTPPSVPTQGPTQTTGTGSIDTSTGLTTRTRPPTQPIHTTSGGSRPTRPPTQPILTTSTAPHSSDYTELTSSTAWDTTPSPDTTTGFETSTTTGFETTGSTTGFETNGSESTKQTSSLSTSKTGSELTDTTVPHTTGTGQTQTGGPCPCPCLDDSCGCDCRDANWEPEDLMK